MQKFSPSHLGRLRLDNVTIYSPSFKGPAGLRKRKALGKKEQKRAALGIRNIRNCYDFTIEWENGDFRDDWKTFRYCNQLHSKARVCNSHISEVLTVGKLNWMKLGWFVKHDIVVAVYCPTRIQQIRDQKNDWVKFKYCYGGLRWHNMGLSTAICFFHPLGIVKATASTSIPLTSVIGFTWRLNLSGNH